MGESLVCDSWRSMWMWSHGAPSKDAYVYFRKVFVVPAKVSSCVVFVSANDRYRLHLNGRFVGRGPAPSDPRQKYYDAWEITKRLSEGRNVLAAVVYNFGRGKRNRIFAGRGGFILQAEMKLPDGREYEIVTDNSWKAEVARAWQEPKIAINDWDIGYRENFDPGLEPSGWRTLAFDDSEWPDADIVGVHPSPPFEELLPRDILPLERREMPPRAVVRASANAGSIRGQRSLLRGGHAVIDASVPGSFPELVLDYGTEAVGYPEFELEARADGGTMLVSYGETLDLRRLDSLRLRRGKTVWGPFGRRAFRYLGVQFVGAPKPVRLRAARVRAVRYPFEERGDFSCSDKLLTSIWKTSRETVRACAQDHFEDTPLREQALWMGDARVMALSSYHLFGDYLLPAKCLRQFARVQHESGAVPGVGPAMNDLILPDYCLLWVVALNEHHLHSGDRAFLAEMFVPMGRLLSYFEREQDSFGLIPRCERDGWWTFLDWAELDRRGHSTALNILLHAAFRSGADVAEALGRDPEAVRWRRMAERAGDSLIETAYDPEAGLFVDSTSDLDCTRSRAFSRQTNALAVTMGLVQGTKAEGLVRRLFESPSAPAITTAYMNSELVEAAFTAREEKRALKLLRSYWGEMLARGAKTFWETFDPATPRSSVPFSSDPRKWVSLCHGWSSGPAYILMRRVLGILPLDPGFRRILVRPHARELSWAKGVVPTPRGELRVKWRAEKGTFKLGLGAPPEVEIEAHVPLPRRGAFEVLLGRKLVYSTVAPVRPPSGVTSFMRRDGCLVVRTKGLRRVDLTRRPAGKGPPPRRRGRDQPEKTRG